ncbi:MAG: type II toxin-antitoxin system VapC family toxin [Candidatus Korarchaeota archaeon]|nr:type II toxin-antitoxin system VapC family toxin [Candidatus Korarchaeota archaeon]NIU85239.1 PIN domain-containing protein [Candidatus Thorarchaeota archaeon]NIW15322.1 PIN domain-containing protein [Candidatus Thorarchaeota archaeon]NIW53287.1 PIN domain-containing protein [Candidatus Korarchaeota archaeon]
MYYFSDTLPERAIDTIEKIFRTSFNVSIITKIEFLGWGKHTDEGFKKARKFIGFAEVIPLTNEIADLTINIKRKRKIMLPDAVIAATALKNDLILVTRNEDDFKDVQGLEIYNPFNE